MSLILRRRFRLLKMSSNLGSGSSKHARLNGDSFLTVFSRGHIAMSQNSMSGAAILLTSLLAANRRTCWLRTEKVGAGRLKMRSASAVCGITARTDLIVMAHISLMYSMLLGSRSCLSILIVADHK